MGANRNNKYEELYGLYLEGYSMGKIAKDFNISRQSIFKAFKLRKYVLRSPNFQPTQFYNGKKFTLRQHGYYELTTGERTLMHRYIWEKEKGVIPKEWDIHHKDENKANNVIENFECLSKADHTKLYSPHNNQHTKGRKKNEAHKPI